MMVDRTTKWIEEAEVVIVGYGGAGAVAAITAHDAGAKVLILEKQPNDTPTQTRHTPNTRMSGGAWFCSTDLEKAVLYLEGMAKIANEALDRERKEMIHVLAQHLIDNTDWMVKIGIELGGDESVSPTFARELKHEGMKGKVFAPDFPELPGSDGTYLSYPKITGNYRHGAALFRGLSEAVRKRKIQVMWETQARQYP